MERHLERSALGRMLLSDVGRGVFGLVCGFMLRAGAGTGSAISLTSYTVPHTGTAYVSLLFAYVSSLLAEPRPDLSLKHMPTQRRPLKMAFAIRP